MPQKTVIFLFAAVLLLAVACGDDIININALPGGDPDVQADGDTVDPVVTDGDSDDGIDLPDGPEIPDTADSDDADEPDGVDAADGDAEFPWEAEAPDIEEDVREYDFIDGTLTEFSAPGCVGDEEYTEEENNAAEADYAPTFNASAPVLVNHTGYSRATKRNSRLIDCGHGVVLAMWEDSRKPFMYALSNDEGNTWTENKPLFDYEGLQNLTLHGVGSSDTGVVAFLRAGSTTAYFARLHLPITDIEHAEWTVTSNATFLRSWEPNPDFLDDVAALSENSFMFSWRWESTKHLAITNNGGENVRELPYDPRMYTTLPGDRYLLMRVAPGVEDRIQYQILSSDGEPFFNEWQEQGLSGDILVSLDSGGGHVALTAWVGSDYRRRDLLRFDFNLESLSFNAPYMVYSGLNASMEDECDPPAPLSASMNRDGRIMLSRTCSSNPSVLDEILFYWQESVVEPAVFSVIPLPQITGNRAYFSGILLESGKQLAAVTRSTILVNIPLTENRWWHPPTFWDIEVYAGSTGMPPTFSRIAIINDDSDILQDVRNARLVPLEDGNAGVAWQTQVDSGLWANTLLQARAGEKARWLYNIPALYSEYDITVSSTEPVWVPQMEDLSSWDGRPCMVTLPDFNVRSPSSAAYENTTGVALSCFESWSSFIAGARPGPLEVLWRDSRVPSQFKCRGVNFVPPTEYGRGFAAVQGMYPETDNVSLRGLLFYDDATKQWPYMQFMPYVMGFLYGVGRVDAGTLVAFGDFAVLYSYDEGRSWTAPRQPLGYLIPSGFEVRALQVMQRSHGALVAIVSMNYETDTARGNISALTYDCASQEWDLMDTPELSYHVSGMQAVEMENGALALVYTQSDSYGPLMACILNPDTGSRSDPMVLAEPLEGQYFTISDILYHEGRLSVAYIATLPASVDINNRSDYHELYVVQARVEQGAGK